MDKKTARKAKATGKKSGLTSAFSKKGKSGKPCVVPSSANKKDPRNQLFVEGFHPNFMMCHGKKFNKDEDMFGGYFYTALEADDKLMEEIEACGVFPMRGSNGSHLPQGPGSLWAWKGTLFALDEEKDQEEERRSKADKFTAKFNDLATTENCRFPRKMKFAKDLTGESLRKLDQALLDEDVVRVMQHAYGHAMDLESMKDNAEIMEMFWTDEEHGKRAIDSFILSSADPDDVKSEDG